MATTAGMVFSCSGSGRSGGFDSPVPAARIDAVEEVVAAWRATPANQRVLPRATRRELVECLRSDDDLLRFLTIEALTEMTGDSRGYRFDDTPTERLAAIDAWIPWADEGQP